ncbi:chlororespiratory reduction 6 domain-containing protein [Streptomyces sp. NPDC048278]|uniref:chlororespiratory reduction 6 domain-containing protein n=1 Tax=unclassified Streptomyces TaxID=2593676 RepID=UPI0034162B8D
MPAAEGDRSRGAREPTFQERVDALCVSVGDGTRRVDLNSLRELVESDPEQTAVTCRSCVRRAVERGRHWHGYAQVALTLAQLYESIFDDDTLTIWVTDEFERAGVTVREPRMAVLDPETGGLSRPEDHPDDRPVVLDVERRLIDSGDIYPLVSFFSHHPDPDGQDRDQVRRLREHRCRVMFTFDIPTTDPREVWEVPEVRAYVAQLAERMPYLPYYFLPREFGTLFTWLACLAPQEARSGGGIQLLHPDVLLHAALAYHYTWRFAQWLGDDPDAVVRDVFSTLPEAFMPYVREMHRRLEEQLGDAL